MTEEEKKDIKERFLKLIGKVVDNNISDDPKIKELINNFLVCLDDMDYDKCIKILELLKELIEAIIEELKRQGLIPPKKETIENIETTTRAPSGGRK